MVDGLQKTCRHCKIEKPIAAFSLEPSVPGKHRAECKVCRAAIETIRRRKTHPLLPVLTAEQRFWVKVRKADGDACWGWLANVCRKGYGSVRWGGRRSEKSHRVSWEIHHGPIPAGVQVLHRCDNPPCCNPAHLFLGTNDDNVADKVAKGRQVRGTRVRTARLTEAAVRQIRADAAAGESPKRLARRHGVNPQTVRAVARGRSWRHVA